MTSRQKTWTIGGLALIACGVIGMLQVTLPAAQGLIWLSRLNDLFYAVALLLFAFGLTREASLFERKPLGTTALAVLGLWPLAAFGLRELLTATGAGTDAWMMFSYFAIALPTAAAIIATMQIARSGVVAGNWRWLPLGALALYALAWTVPQVVAFAVGSLTGDTGLGIFIALAAIAFLAGTIGLGVSALIVAARQPVLVPETA